MVVEYSKNIQERCQKISKSNLIISQLQLQQKIYIENCVSKNKNKYKPLFKVGATPLTWGQKSCLARRTHQTTGQPSSCSRREQQRAPSHSDRAGLNLETLLSPAGKEASSPWGGLPRKWQGRS